MRADEHFWDLLLGQTPERVPAGPGSFGRFAASLRQRSPGTRVVLLDGGPLTSLRRTWIAARAGLQMEHRYAVLPSASSAYFVVERDRDTERYFGDRLLAAPPRARPWTMLAVRALQSSGGAHLLRAFARFSTEVTIWRRH